MGSKIGSFKIETITKIAHDLGIEFSTKSKQVDCKIESSPIRESTYF